MSDEFQLDLGIDPADATEAVKKGIDAGVKKGLSKGASEKMQPAAEKAAAEAIDNMMSGGSTSSQVATAIKNMTDLAQTDALRAVVDGMKARNNPQQQQQNPASTLTPAQKVQEMMQMITSMGLDPKDIPKKTLLKIALNPDNAAFLLMMDDDDDRDRRPRNPYADMMPFMIQNMMQPRQQQQQQQAPQKDSTAELLTVLITSMQQQQQAQSEMFQMMMNQQAQFGQERVNLTIEAMKPYMQHRSFGEEIAEIAEKREALKAIGMGDRGEKTDLEAKLDFEYQKMALDLKREDAKIAREEAAERRKLEAQKLQWDNTIQIINTGKNLIKNLKLEVVPEEKSDQTLPQPSAKIASYEAPTKPLSRRITDRITNMLINAQKAMREEPSEEGGA